MKEELELKITLSRTEHESELARVQEELEKVKKANAEEVNDHYNKQIAFEDKILSKEQELERVNTELASYQKER